MPASAADRHRRLRQPANGLAGRQHLVHISSPRCAGMLTGACARRTGPRHVPAPQYSGVRCRRRITLKRGPLDPGAPPPSGAADDAVRLAERRGWRVTTPSSVAGAAPRAGPARPAFEGRQLENGRLLREDHRSLEDVLELANVPRPVVSHESMRASSVSIGSEAPTVASRETKSAASGDVVLAARNGGTSKERRSGGRRDPRKRPPRRSRAGRRGSPRPRASTWWVVVAHALELPSWSTRRQVAARAEASHLVEEIVPRWAAGTGRDGRGSRR